MSTKRASLFENEDVDLSEFQSIPVLKENEPSKEDVKAISAEAGFSSREPTSGTVSSKEVITSQKKAVSRRKAFNASDDQKVQLNIRTTEDIAGTFYRITKDNDWSLGQTLKRALSALQRELDQIK